MSVLNTVFAASRHEYGRVLVYLIECEHKGLRVKHSKAARVLGMHRHTVRRAIAQLVAQDLVQQHDGSRYTVNHEAVQALVNGATQTTPVLEKQAKVSNVPTAPKDPVGEWIKGVLAKHDLLEHTGTNEMALRNLYQMTNGDIILVESKLEYALEHLGKWKRQSGPWGYVRGMCLKSLSNSRGARASVGTIGIDSLPNESDLEDAL